MLGCGVGRPSSGEMPEAPAMTHPIPPGGETHHLHDFGSIEQGDDVSHTFFLRNETGATVTFQQEPLVEMGCCIVAKLSPSEVAPGETAELSVKYQTRLRPGPFRWGIKIFPSQESFPSDFQIVGEVSQLLVVDPIQLNFETAGDLDFQVSGVGLNRDYQLSRVTTNSPHLTVERHGPPRMNGSETVMTYRVHWDGQRLPQKPTPVVYVVTDSQKLQWFPVLIFTP